MNQAKNECVLLIECHPADARLITNALKTDVHEGLNVESVKRISEGVNRIHKGGVRGVIVDIEMPNSRGVAAFENLLAAAPHIPIPILSGVENENVAKQAVDRGAQDYLLKRNLDHFRLRRAVHLMIQRYANEEKSFFQQRCAEMTFACSDDAVIISDSAHRVTHLNAPAELLTGWSQAEARGHALNEILGETACVDPLAAASGAHEDAPCADTAILRRRDGVELNIKNCSGYIRDRDGNVTGTVAVLHDLGAVRAQIVELSLAAQHDFLTGLPNRSLVDDRITQAISFSARYNKQLAVMQARVLEWQSLEGSLRCALERHEFMLEYQPKIDLATGEISGVEALLRWNHPDRGIIQPLKFVPIAEESGLIVPIGQWVLLEACRQARAWMDAGLPPVRIAVNVSALQFAAKDFLYSVRAALISTGMDPHNLEPELTETVLMQDAESAVQTLRALKAIGVQLAVDDFGVGYSSFSYPRKFPLDALKVDRSFINDISSNPHNATILSALIGIGKSLNQHVVAEGVETEEQLHFLQNSEGQGYFFCLPIIAEKFAQFLERGIAEAVVH